ncbi:phosphatase PAP2 family protein [Microcella alkaliphila]|uniref:phosphatase PAP2 family protein n=1 Tax=Microcella alkaliphila TaxID=279828 RepID=UPI000BBA803D|nr:phosphatase PAP2 family protein [Microcella alkaliphila]
MSSVREARKIRRRWPVISAAVGMGVAVLLGALIALRGSPLAADEEFMNELLEERAPWFDLPALFLDWVGGHLVGIVIVPIAMVIWLLALRRPWAAGFSIVAAAVSAGLVQLLKALFDRARPEFMLVASDEGSFPSGHVANAATIAVVLALVFGLERSRWWVWVVGAAYIVAMALARTYLGVHWVTDTIGGALLGAGVAVMLWAPIADRLAAEPRERTPRGG